MTEQVDLSKSTLVELCNAFVAKSMEDDGEVTDEWLAIDRAIDGKVERYQWAASAMRAKRAALVGEREYYKKMMAKLSKPIDAVDARLERMEQSLIDNMDATDKTVIETSLGTLRIKKAPHIELAEGLLIEKFPEEYLRSKPEVDKGALLATFRRHLKMLAEAKNEDDEGKPLWKEEDAIRTAASYLPAGVKVVYRKILGGF